MCMTEKKQGRKIKGKRKHGMDGWIRLPALYMSRSPGSRPCSIRSLARNALSLATPRQTPR